jgi:amidase
MAMKFKSPSAIDLQSVGGELGLKLSNADAAAMRALMAPLLHSYEFLEAAPNALPTLKYPRRTHHFPEDKDNPFRAWYVKTSIEGASSGPLAGRTVAIKDVIFIAGVPMMNGASIMDGFVPDFDATVVTRVLDAGAMITGKAACEYLCVSGGSSTASTGVIENPRKAGYSTGGSSSGCAALIAGGHVDMAIGSDQAGSVRAPASLTGICGMKATFGLVPFTGAVSQEVCIDHLGPMTANVADNALLLEVLAGHDGYDGRQQELAIHKYTAALGRGVQGLKIGVVSEGFGQPASDKDVDLCVHAAAARLASMGATVVEVSIPEHTTGIAVWAGIIADGLWQTLKLSGLGSNYRGLYSPAQFDYLEHWTRRLAETPANVRILVMLGKYLERYHGRYYVKAKNLGFQLRAAYDSALAECDLLLMPTTQRKSQSVPKTLDGLRDEEVFALSFVNIENTCQFDVTGHPAISIPCGLRDGLPIGLMLVAKHFDEPTIYRAAHAFEQSEKWEEM